MSVASASTPAAHGLPQRGPLRFALAGINWRGVAPAFELHQERNGGVRGLGREAVSVQSGRVDAARQSARRGGGFTVDADLLQLAAQQGVGLRPGIVPAALQRQKRAADGGGHQQGGDGQRGQGGHVGLVQAELVQQIELALAAVVQHPLVPGVVERVPLVAQLQQQRGVARAEHGHAQQGLARGQGGAAAVDARRVNGGGRVGPHPAAFGQPVFGPGVGVALAHHPGVVHRVEAPALVAGDDARGNACGPYHHDERLRVVFAKTGAAVEQKLVHAVAQAVGARVEGVAEGLVAKHLQQGLRDEGAALSGRLGLRGELPSQRHAARIEARRQGFVGAQSGAELRGAVAKLR